jgi:hypothetical protein
MSTLQDHDVSRGLARRGPPLNTHRLERIPELRAALAANPIGAAIDREYTAQIAVVTTEQKVQRYTEVTHYRLDHRLNSQP